MSPRLVWRMACCSAMAAFPALVGVRRAARPGRVKWVLTGWTALRVPVDPRTGGKPARTGRPLSGVVEWQLTPDLTGPPTLVKEEAMALRKNKTLLDQASDYIE